MAETKTRARYWSAICYPENMRDDWQEVIGDVLQLPYAYCIHDKDHLAGYKAKKGEEYQRKVHVHVMIAFGNTTTEKAAFDTIKALSKPGASCLSTIQQVKQVRNAYEYLIHNTETSIKQKKYRYEVKERITGNNFDIGAYEQLNVSDKNKMAVELCDVILEQGFYNFTDFFDYVRKNMDLEYFEIIKSYSGLFERLTKGNYQKLDLNRRAQEMAYHMAKDMNKTRKRADE